MAKKNKGHKKILYISIAVVLLIIVFLYMVIFFKMNNATVLRLSGYDVEVKEVTFQGYDSQKFLARNGTEKILLQIVKDVEKDSYNEVLEKLGSSVDEAKRDIKLFDPYTGVERSLSVPENLKPVRKKININGKTITYHVVHTNEILSLKIFTETEAKFKGLFSTYYCDKKNTAYKFELYEDTEKFDEKKAAHILKLSFCRR